MIFSPSDRDAMLDAAPRMLYVPTNRACLPAIASGLQEAAEMTRDSPCWFALIEHHDAPYVPDHAVILQNAVQNTELELVVHVTPALWTRFLDAVLDITDLPGPQRHRIHRLHSPGTVAYGVGPNKAALLAAAAGARYLHRRDSDQVPSLRDDDRCLPHVLEVAAVGRTIAEIATQWSVRTSSATATPPTDSPVLATGSALIGDVSLDRRDLDSLDPNLSARIHALAAPNLTLPQLRSRLDNKYRRDPQILYDTDFFEPDTTGTTEMGVSCIADCFLHLPELPTVQTLATDYTIKNLLYQIGSPVLFHSRKMLHIYDEQRRIPDPQSAALYALRDLRYVILRRVRAGLNLEIAQHRDAFIKHGMRFNSVYFAGRYVEHLRALMPKLEEIPAQYAAIHAEAARRASGLAAERLNAVRDAVLSARSEPVETVATGIQDFHWLTTKWRTLIAAATQVDLSEFAVTRRLP